jgi:hypothetical protein
MGASAVVKETPTETLGCNKRIATEVYDAMRASGGYFRNGYNAGDVMWAMGLSWFSTVSPMLDTERRLPVARARELLAMIEERPLTRSRVARHIFEHMTDGVEPHPITGPTAEMIEEAMAERPPGRYRDLRRRRTSTT